MSAPLIDILPNAHSLKNNNTVGQPKISTLSPAITAKSTCTNVLQPSHHIFPFRNTTSCVGQSVHVVFVRTCCLNIWCRCWKRHSTALTVKIKDESLYFIMSH